MLEWIVNGEVRVSTVLKLIGQYWYLIGATALLGIGAVTALIQRANKVK